MNFKLFLILLLISSCGLKRRPVAPKNTSLPSIPASYFSHPEESDQVETTPINVKEKTDESEK